MQHCLFNRYQDRSNYMHLPSVLASPQRVITLQIMCVLNILDNFLSDTAQTTARYLKFDFVWFCPNDEFAVSISFTPAGH